MTATRITEVQIYRGFSTIIITLDEIDGGYEVGAARIYRTHQGGRVEGTFEKPFTDKNAARAYANGYYFHMLKKGWEKVPARKK